MPLQHRLNQCPQPFSRLNLLCLRSQRQLIVEICPLFLSLSDSLPAFYDPFLMLADELFHLFFRRTYRSRHVYIAVLDNAYPQSACPFVCQLYHRNNLQKKPPIPRAFLLFNTQRRNRRGTRAGARWAESGLRVWDGCSAGTSADGRPRHIRGSSRALARAAARPDA